MTIILTSLKMHNRLHPQSQINQRYVSQVRCQPDQEITGKIGVIHFFYTNDTRDNFWLNDFMWSEKSKQILANLELQTRRFKMFNWILSWVKLAISFVWLKKKKQLLGRVQYLYTDFNWILLLALLASFQFWQNSILTNETGNNNLM